MQSTNFRIFISAVTSEFGQARDALAADLRSRELTVRVQSEFRQEAGSDTTLRKIHDYIRGCDAVICLIGQRSGACPPPAATRPFRNILPKGIIRASYTQWEFFIARYYGRRLSLYFSNADYAAQTSPSDEELPVLQHAFVDHIENKEGLDRSYFSNSDQLCRLVLREEWPVLGSSVGEITKRLFPQLAVTAIIMGATIATMSIGPPWPGAALPITLVVEIASATVLYRLFRLWPKKWLVRVAGFASILAIASISAHLIVTSLFVYTAPTTKERFVRGWACTPEASLVFKEKCPLLTLDEIRKAEYSAERLWTNGSIASVRMALVMTWLCVWTSLAITAYAIAAFAPR